MRLLITGICGFVGSAVAETLLERRPGLSIAGIDNLMRPGSEGNRLRLGRLGVTVFHGDLRQPSDLEPLPAAAVRLPSFSPCDPKGTTQTGNKPHLPDKLDYTPVRRWSIWV